MFDLRYHVASLAAVFVALVIGIFVGVGLSGRGFVNDAERKNFEARIDELQADRDSAEAAAKSAARRGDALDAFADTTYTSLVRRRLAGTKVGVVFVGSVDQGLAGTIRRTIADAGGRVVRMRALRVPLDPEAVDQALRGEPDTRELAGEDRRARLGRHGTSAPIGNTVLSRANARRAMIAARVRSAFLARRAGPARSAVPARSPVRVYRSTTQGPYSPPHSCSRPGSDRPSGASLTCMKAP